jgi:hypothetical protein
MITLAPHAGFVFDDESTLVAAANRPLRVGSLKMFSNFESRRLGSIAFETT